MSCGKLMLWEIMLLNFINCTILNIRSSITNLPFLHPALILHKLLSLEDTFKVFMQTVNQVIQPVDQSMQEIKDATMISYQSIQELKDATMVNTQEIAR
jgi:hypothetical protein